MAKAYPDESLLLVSAPELLDQKNHQKYNRFVNITLSALLEVIRSGKISVVTNAEINSLSGKYRKIAQTLIARYKNEYQDGSYKKGNQAYKNVYSFYSFFATDSADAFFKNLMKSGVDIDWMALTNYLHDPNVDFSNSYVVTKWIEMVADEVHNEDLTNN